MSLHLLRSNLCELSFSSRLDETLLIGDGKRIFLKNRGTGAFLSLFSSNVSTGEKLQKTLTSVKAHCWKEIEKLQKAKKVYFTELAATLKRKRPNPKALETAEKTILVFCLHLRPFMKQVIKGEEKPYIAFLCQDEKGDRRESLVKLFSAVALCRRLKDFSLVTGEEVPLPLLLKICRDKELKVGEADTIQHWLKQVKASSSKKIPSFGPSLANTLVRAPFFHKLLHDATGFFKEAVLEEGESPDLGLLEARLISAGYQAFNEPDEEHLCWRAKVKAGDTLDIGGKEYKLGKALHAAELQIDDPFIFEVVNQPELEVVLPWTPSDPYLKHLDQRSFHCGLIQQKVIGVGRRGAVLVRERLYEPFSDIRWRGRSLDVSDPEDQNNLEPLIELIKGFLTLPFTPYPLDLKNFGYTLKGEMRASALLRPIHKSFEHLENFAYECAYANTEFFNQAIYRKLMWETGLAKCQEALAYRDVVIWALEGCDEESVITLNGEITLADIVARRQTLYCQIQDVQATLLAQLQCAGYELPKEDLLQKKLSQAIMETYEDRCPGSLLIPQRDFELLAYDRFLYLEKPLFQLPIFEEICKEIEAEMADYKTLPPNRRKRAYYRRKGIYDLGQAKLALNRGIQAFHKSRSS